MAEVSEQIEKASRPLFEALNAEPRHAHSWTADQVSKYKLNRAFRLIALLVAYSQTGEKPDPAALITYIEQNMG